MTLIFKDTHVCFDDVCTVEEAVQLIEHLRAHNDAHVDLSGCSYLHTALVQLLLIARPRMATSPCDPFLARWLAPLLSRDGEAE